MIYAIEAIGTGFIKFGRAKSVGKRLRELEIGNPHELHILAVADWPDRAEIVIHIHLEPVSIRGEWFKDGPQAREVISWMVNGQAGLERILRDMPASLQRKTLSRQRSLARTRPLIEPSIEQRRAEREAWWKAKNHVQAQQSTAAIHKSAIPRIVSKSNASLDQPDTSPFAEVSTMTLHNGPWHAY